MSDLHKILSALMFVCIMLLIQLYLEGVFG